MRDRPRIVIAPASALPPFPVEAFVVEQDRDLLLEWQPGLREPEAPLERLVTEMRRARPPPAGTVLVRGAAVPYTFLALVHDFACEPSCRADWVAAALEAVWDAAATRRLDALALPLLGTVHGRLAVSDAAELLAASLVAACAAPARIWLLFPLTGDAGAIAAVLCRTGIATHVGR